MTTLTRQDIPALFGETIAGFTPTEVAAIRRSWRLEGKCDEQAADLIYYRLRCKELEEMLPLDDDRTLTPVIAAVVAAAILFAAGALLGASLMAATL